ncbi:MAG TPA: chondroitinase-B domain-containing protein [Opitutaceae bacterium]|nr:chondroitinase-B domain-containing protein [Opitutaceae bacterium]
MNPILQRASLMLLFSPWALSVSQAQTPNPPETSAPVPAVEKPAPPPGEGSPVPALTPPLVDSIAALQSRLSVAAPGDTIILKNGSYTVSALINIRCRGTADRPITIAAESIGGVEITGAHGFKASAPAEHIVISGFKFTHAAGRAQIADGTRHVRLTRNTFQCTGEGHDLTVAGDDAQVDHNDFGPKKFPGTMIAVSGTGSQVARGLWIHHNYFHDFENDGGSGAEMLRVGLLSSHRTSVGATRVEHNLFARCRGVNDLISNRSSGNTFRYNTFIESPTAHLTVRQGNDCAIYGNIFRNTEGIRLYGDRHQVFSNYLESNYVAIAIGNGTAEISELGDAAPPNSHDRPDGCVIAFNTLVDNNTHYQMSRRPGEALGATNTTFAHNVLQGGAVAAKIDGPNTGAIWSDNVAWNVAKLRDLPAEGQTVSDPLLAADGTGIKRPQTGSPVIAAAKESFPFVTVDVDGQPRPEKKSLGADEPGASGIVARLLSTDDVGPAANLAVRETTMPTNRNPEPATPAVP